MSDLSRLLGDVYHKEIDDSTEPEAPPVDETWSQEQVDMLAPEPEEAAPTYSLDDEWSMVQAEELEGGAEWADDDTLDEAFADWTPGPDGAAHDLEYFTDTDDADQFELAADEYEDETVDHFVIDEDDAFAVEDEDDEAEVYETTGEVTEIDWTAEEPGYLTEAPVEAAPWRRGDDDLLPRSGGRRRGRKR
jgi:hypothetical protein